MDIFDIKIPKDSDVYVCGDWHVGSLTFKEKACIEMIERIKRKKNAYLILLGDLVEAIACDDKRFAYDQKNRILNTPMQEAQYVRRLLVPIKHKIIGILQGNHEWTLRKYGNLVKDVFCFNSETGKPDIRFCTISCVFRINNSFEIYAHHGYGVSRNNAYDPKQLSANELVSIKRKLQRKYGGALLMVMGHIHKLRVSEPDERLYLTTENKTLKAQYTNRPRRTCGLGYIQPEERWYASAGCLKGAYEMGTSGYEELFGLDPTELGYLKVKIRDSKLINVERVVID